MKLRNIITNVELTEKEYNEMLKREYKEYLEEVDEDEAMTFDRFAESDTDFEVVEDDEALEYLEEQNFKDPLGSVLFIEY